MIIYIFFFSFKGIFVSEPMSMYENYIAKSVLMEDLNRLKFYLMNTSNTNNGHPAMGMYIVNVTDTGSATDLDNLTDTDTGGASTTGLKDNTKPETTTTTNKPSHQLKTTDIKSANESKVTSTATPTLKETTESHASTSTARNKITIDSLPNQLTTSSSINRASSVKTDFFPTRYRSVSTTTSKLSSFTRGGLDSLTSKGVSEDPLVSLSSSTMDPDVQKSLAELNKYLQVSVTDSSLH